jgi:hypothetical protein
MVIRRIAPLSAARIAGLIYTLVGLPFALAVWIVSLVGLNKSGLRDSPFLPVEPSLIIGGGAVAVVIFPILYGGFCFVMTFVGAWLYNLVARFAGGLSVDVQVETPQDASAG